MKAIIISIGNELLIGETLNTNAHWMASELTKIGVVVLEIRTIQDEENEILETLKLAQQKVDIVLITGGLGPTKDDITKHTLAHYFNDTLHLNKEVLTYIKERFKKLNYPFNKLNENQALVPSTCTVLKNNWGTAPGMWFEHANKVVVSMPGVPYEMKGIMQQSVLPKLQQKYKLPYLLNISVLTQGIGESSLAERIEDWETNLPSTIKLAYLPSFGKVRLRLSATGYDLNAIKEQIDAEISKLRPLLNDYFVAIDNLLSVEEAIGKKLTAQKLTIAVAESCTIGTISKKIAEVPGASNYFKGGIVAYAKEMKQQLLNVSATTIKKYSVVSEQVAEEMAKGIQKKMKTDYAIATTGNAGPTTDETDETVGVVYIALATPTASNVTKFNFGQPREKVIENASNKALELLKKEIYKND